jgi:hypothetical protein
MMHDQGVETWYSGTLRIYDIISSRGEIRKLFNLSSQCLTRKLNMIEKGFFLNKWNSVCRSKRVATLNQKLLLKTKFARNATQVKLKMNNFFLLNCGFYHNHRNKLFEAIKLNCKFENFKLLLSLNKLFWLLNSKNINILTEICRFLLDNHCISDKWWSVLYYLNSDYYLFTLFVSCIYDTCGPYYG